MPKLEEKKQIEQDAREKAGDLICDNCVYLGKIKDGRDAYFCHDGSLSSVLVFEKNYNNYTSGLRISDLILRADDDYCLIQAGRMAYEQGLFTLNINKLDKDGQDGDNLWRYSEAVESGNFHNIQFLNKEK